MMKKPLKMALGLAAVIVLLMVGLPWLSPGKGVERAYEKLISGVMENDFEDVTLVIDADYRDAWDLNRAEAITLAQELRRHFIICGIESSEPKLTLLNGKHSATMAARIQFQGTGDPVAQALVQYSAQTRSPTTFTFVRHSWKPWDWKLSRIDNAEASAGVRRLQRMIDKNGGGGLGM